MHINTLFKRDSVELSSYLKKNPIGTAIVASDSSKVWTVKDIILRTDLPPDPLVGSVVMVQLVLETPD